MRKIFINIFFICLSIFFFNSCDAPHNNLLDPDNPDSQAFYYIMGRVTKTDEEQQIQTPAANVKVFLEKEGVFTKSDNNGYYKLMSYNQVDQKIIFEGAHFFSDTVQVNWGNQKKIEINANLDIKPEPDSIINYSIISWFFDSDLGANSYTQALYIQIKIGKLDLGRIDSVNIVNQDLKINYCIYNSNQSGVPEITLLIDKLKIKDLDEITGKKFSVYIHTASKKMYHYKDIVFMRSIKESALAISPVNGDAINIDSVLFKWTPLNSAYKCFYQIQIYNNQFAPYELLGSSGIFDKSINEFKSKPNDFTSLYKLAWRIVSIDEFGNRNISVPFSFIYKPVAQ